MKFISVSLRYAMCAALLVLSAQAGAQGKVVRLVVPFAAGGGQDILARSFNAELGAALRQPVIVEPRAGAGGGVRRVVEQKTSTRRIAEHTLKLRSRTHFTS